MNNEQLAIIDPGELMRRATDVAGVCSEIVKNTAISIQGRKYVKVEGWEAIAAAHGYVAGATNVQRVETGWTAVGELRRISDGCLIATGEGFVGDDEVVWAGGTNKRGEEVQPRQEYAIRAMAQTRAISRVCRSAFAHVVVLIDKDMSTTPAEEMPREEKEVHDRTGRRTELKTDSATREIEIEALKKFLVEHQIPEAFLIKLCVAGQLADGTEEFITDLKDGVIKRLRTPKLRDAILDRWKKSGTPSATAGLSTPPAADWRKEMTAEHDATIVAATPEKGKTANVTDAMPRTWKRPQKIPTNLTPSGILNFGQVDSWKEVIVPSGTNKDIALGDLTVKQRQYYITKWMPPKASEDGGYDDIDMLFDAALTLAAEENE